MNKARLFKPYAHRIKFIEIKLYGGYGEIIMKAPEWDRKYISLYLNVAGEYTDYLKDLR